MNAPRFAIVDEGARRRAPLALVLAAGHAVRARASTANFLFFATAWALYFEVHEVGAWFGKPVPPQPPTMWLSHIVVLTSLGTALWLAVLIADDAVARGARRGRSYALAVVVGTATGAVVQYLVRWPLGFETMVSHEDVLVRLMQPVFVFFDVILFTGLLTFLHVNLATARGAAARRHAAELERAQTQRRTVESRLQAMQARVEPQFLFNTLAQVKQLYDSDGALADRMLDDLIAYLRAALPHLRESSSTLGQEAALARAYLDIVRLRLGRRLAFDISIPETLAAARMPPMMLLPLIDHVLVYGLEPAHAGGAIRIESAIGGGRLRLTITDSGAGFVPGGDAGDLGSIDERLRALYGDDATLRLAQLADNATQAVLDIPYEPRPVTDVEPTGNALCAQASAMAPVHPSHPSTLGDHA
jgi:hypothetical protein